MARGEGLQNGVRLISINALFTTTEIPAPRTLPPAADQQDRVITDERVVASPIVERRVPAPTRREQPSLTAPLMEPFKAVSPLFARKICGEGLRVCPKAS